MTAEFPQPRTALLNDGNRIPIIAFGTGTAQAWTDTYPVVKAALASGLTHLDCAYHYKNQVHTGKAVRERIAAGTRRDEFFVSTKGGDFDAPAEEFDMRRWLEANLRDLGLDYVDLYLIHADFLVSSVPDAWKQMEKIKRDGLARSIGVSNFSTESLKAVLEVCEILPAVNQIEFHPYSLPCYLPALLPLCKQHNILIECFGPLMSIVRHLGGPVDEAVVRVVAERGRRETEGQVLLMWGQQYTGGVVLTTTTKPERMVEQVAPFLTTSASEPLSDEHMQAITDAGAVAPYRHWGINWPYFMKGEGGIEACPPGADWRVKPVKRTDLDLVKR